MHLSHLGVIVYAGTEEARKKLRYAAVSVIFVPIGEILIQVLGLWLHNYTTAWLLQAAIITVPNFFANKHFVWRVTSRENLRSQMLVFWVAVMLGVALATLFTHLVENAVTDRTNLVRGANTIGRRVINAIRAAVEAARSDVVIVSMADLSDDLRVVDDIVRADSRTVTTSCAPRAICVGGGRSVGRS